MAVIAWYLPTLADVAKDLSRLVSSAALGVEGLGVDIESRKVEDAAERNRRLVDLEPRSSRERLPGRPIAAVTMPPVVTDVINPAFWPGFPWQELRPLYDLWMPMNYWTFRKADSGYRDAYRYTAENIDLTRKNLGRPQCGRPRHRRYRRHDHHGGHRRLLPGLGRTRRDRRRSLRLPHDRRRSLGKPQALPRLTDAYKNERACCKASSASGPSAVRSAASAAVMRWVARRHHTPAGPVIAVGGVSRARRTTPRRSGP